MNAILFFFSALAVAFYITGPIQDPDLWWHIVVGKWIIAHHAVPEADLWGLFSAGQPWRAYSWSNEVIYALAERWGGVKGLLLLKFGLASFIALSFCLCFAKLSKDWFMGALLGIFATLACFNHFTLRPQSLTWALLAWTLLLAQQIHEDKITARRALFLLVLGCIWANSHLSALLGLVSVVAWTASSPRSFARRDCWLAGGAFFAGTLITPYLGGEWLTFFHKTSHPFKYQVIAEFQAATVLQYSTGFLVIIAAVLGLLVVSRPVQTQILRYLLWMGFTLGALSVVKFLPFAVLVSCALVAVLWQEVRNAAPAASIALSNFRESIERLRAVIVKVPREGLSFVLLCSAVVSFWGVWQIPIARQVTPVDAVDFIEKHKLPHPIINIFGHGGYLMYRFSTPEGIPLYKTAIDGRTNLISDEVWNAYMAASRGKKEWRKYFDLVQPRTVLWRNDSPLVTVLRETGEWCLVFDSEDQSFGAVVFISRELYEERKGEMSSSNCG